jgi:hypothetical protein
MSPGKLVTMSKAVLLSERIFQKVRIPIGRKIRLSIICAPTLIQNPAGRE